MEVHNYNKNENYMGNFKDELYEKSQLLCQILMGQLSMICLMKWK